jgi:hypothetical protein
VNNAFSRKASLPHMAFALQINQNNGLQNVALLCSLNPTLQQLLQCPFQRTWLSLFWLISPEAVLLTLKKKEGWPVISAGRAYGGNAGLAFAMCEARKKRKNRQGGLKHRYDLIFGYFPLRESN